jgi:hypothetical protein
LLGIPVPPETGDYFVSLATFARKNGAHEESSDAAVEHQASQSEELEEQLDTATTRPWKKSEFPALAEWLEGNAKPLALIVQATRRPRRYDPLVSAPDDPTPVMSADLARARECRSLAGALTARAMLRVAEGQLDDAWEDLLAVHRMSRLVSKGPGLVEGLVAFGVNQQACAAERTLLQHAVFNAEQLARMRSDLDGLASSANIVEKLDVSERFECLDSVFSVQREMSGTVARGKQTDPYLQKLLKLGGRSRVDWDLVFMNVNSWWDRQIEASRLANRVLLRMALAKMVDDEFQEKTKQAKRIGRSVMFALGSRYEVSERIANVLIALLTPAMDAALSAEERAAMDLDLTKLAFALAAYRADHDCYPEGLVDLVPQYMAKVPDDVFAGVPLRYTLKDGGYLLQSVGRDGEAAVVPEAGKEAEAEWSDDLIVRMPAVARSQP